MLKLTFKLGLIFICGYLIIEWLPIYHPFRLENFIIGIILHPLEFFAASTAFFVGMIINAQIFQAVIQNSIRAVKKQIPWTNPIFFMYPGLFLTYFFLFQHGWEQTLALFSLSFLYGMISVEV